MKNRNRNLLREVYIFKEDINQYSLGLLKKYI